MGMNSVDQHARRLFKRLREDMQETAKRVDNIVGMATDMRRHIATASLNLAEVESLYVDQSDGKRKSDAALYVAQTEIENLSAKLTLAMQNLEVSVTGEKTKIDALKHQTDRICNERFIRDDEDKGIVPNTEYVDLNYFSTQLGIAVKTVRRWVEDGTIPEHNTVSKGAGRPKALWIKSKADVIILGLRREGRAAAISRSRPPAHRVSN